jgi:hypothetical protein
LSGFFSSWWVNPLVKGILKPYHLRWQTFISGVKSFGQTSTILTTRPPRPSSKIWNQKLNTNFLSELLAILIWFTLYSMQIIKFLVPMSRPAHWEMCLICTVNKKMSLCTYQPSGFTTRPPRPSSKIWNQKLNTIYLPNLWGHKCTNWHIIVSPESRQIGN